MMMAFKRGYKRDSEERQIRSRIFILNEHDDDCKDGKTENLFQSLANKYNSKHRPPAKETDSEFSFDSLKHGHAFTNRSSSNPVYVSSDDECVETAYRGPKKRYLQKHRKTTNVQTNTVSQSQAKYNAINIYTSSDSSDSEMERGSNYNSGNRDRQSYNGESADGSHHSGSRNFNEVDKWSESNRDSEFSNSRVRGNASNHSTYGSDKSDEEVDIMNVSDHQSSNEESDRESVKQKQDSDSSDNDSNNSRHSNNSNKRSSGSDQESTDDEKSKKDKSESDKSDSSSDAKNSSSSSDSDSDSDDDNNERQSHSNERQSHQSQSAQSEKSSDESNHVNSQSPKRNFDANNFEPKRKRQKVDYSLYFDEQSSEADDKSQKSVSRKGATRANRKRAKTKEESEDEYSSGLRSQKTAKVSKTSSKLSTGSDNFGLSDDATMKSEKSDIFKCEVCLCRFTSMSTLLRHSSIHKRTGKVEKSDSPFTCDKCNKSFSTNDQLESHILKHRPRSKPQQGSFICPNCNRRFFSETRYAMHISLPCNEGIEEQQKAKEQKDKKANSAAYICKWCKRHCSSMQSLTQHERRHTGDKPYTCSQCNQAFVSYSEWCTHERIHTGERPYSCPHCPKSFRTSGDFIRHKRTHTGEKPHVCSYCSKTFISASEKKSHEKIHQVEGEERKVTTGQHVCDICGMGFVRKDCWRIHWYKHKEVREGDKFACGECGYRAGRRDALETHKQTHVKGSNTQHSCDKCSASFRSKASLTKHKRKCQKGSDRSDSDSDEERVNSVQDQKPQKCGQCFQVYYTEHVCSKKVVNGKAEVSADKSGNDSDSSSSSNSSSSSSNSSSASSSSSSASSNSDDSSSSSDDDGDDNDGKRNDKDNASKNSDSSEDEEEETSSKQTAKKPQDKTPALKKALVKKAQAPTKIPPVPTKAANKEPQAKTLVFIGKQLDHRWKEKKRGKFQFVWYKCSVLGIKDRRNKDPTYEVIYEGAPDIYLLKHSELQEDWENGDLKFL